MNAPELKKLIDWLMDGARSAPTPVALLAQTCERLVAAGVPLWRGAAFVKTLHPDMFGRSFVWRAGTEVVVGSADFDLPESPTFIRSPLAILYNSGHEVRYRLDDPESKRFPFFDDMRAEGVTDYIALPLHFTDGSTHASSWITKEPGGFTDEQLTGLKAIIPPFARLGEIYAMRRTAATLLDTYVGNRAGRAWISRRRYPPRTRGNHAGGDLAVGLAWFHHAVGPARSPKCVVDILNQYFDCQVPAIRKHGGEILKFMGDGLLAVFPIAKDGGNLGEVCGRVLEAAREARANVDAMRYPSGEAVRALPASAWRCTSAASCSGNIRRLEPARLHLHPDPAVNLAARLEKIASRLHRTVIASAAFAGVSAGGWTDLGEFPIAGFSKAQRVFGLKDET